MAAISVRIVQKVSLPLPVLEEKEALLDEQSFTIYTNKIA